MLMIRRLLVIPLLFLMTSVYAQFQGGIGYTGGWMYSNTNIAGGFAFYFGHNIVHVGNSALSLSTNAKIGIADRVGTGVLVPMLIAALEAACNNSPDLSNVDNNEFDGGKIHLFADVPLLLHYNFGLGSTPGCKKKFGFYLGGGISYTNTGYTDTSDFSKDAGFFGYVMDGGLRFAKNVDINIANTISARKPIGPMTHPVFVQITLSLRLDYNNDAHRQFRK